MRLRAAAADVHLALTGSTPGGTAVPSRTSARTCCVASASCRTSSRPMLPVAPVTKIISILPLAPISRTGYERAGCESSCGV